MEGEEESNMGKEGGRGGEDRGEGEETTHTNIEEEEEVHPQMSNWLVHAFFCVWYASVISPSVVVKCPIRSWLPSESQS